MKIGKTKSVTGKLANIATNATAALVNSGNFRNRSTSTGIGGPAFLAHVKNEQPDAHGEHGPDEPVEVIVFDGKPAQAEKQARESEREKNGAEKIVVVAALVRRKHMVAEKNGIGEADGKQAERNPRGEDGPPVVGIEQKARKDGAEDKSVRVPGGEQSEHPPALAPGVDLGADRERGRQEHAHAEALDHSQRDQARHVGRPCAGDHGRRIEGRSGQEHAGLADRIADAGEEQHGAGCGDEVSERYPDDHAGAGIELVDHVPEGDRHEARIETRQRRRQQQRSHDKCAPTDRDRLRGLNGDGGHGNSSVRTNFRNVKQGFPVPGDQHVHQVRFFAAAAALHFRLKGCKRLIDFRAE